MYSLYGKTLVRVETIKDLGVIIYPVTYHGITISMTLSPNVTELMV